MSGDIARTLGIEGAPSFGMGSDTAAVRAEWAASSVDGLLVLYRATAEKKGVDVLLDAVAGLNGARLEILGDGPERAALEARTARLGLDERVRFRGRQPSTEVVAALARAQVVVIPSRVGSDGDMEGTPVVLCEAMAAGVPVVASDLGGLGECIVEGTTGLLVPPDDAAALTVVLEKVLTGAVDLEAIGRAAADEASRTLDIGAVGAEYARVFDDVVEGR